MSLVDVMLCYAMRSNSVPIHTLTVHLYVYMYVCKFSLCSLSVRNCGQKKYSSSILFSSLLFYSILRSNTLEYIGLSGNPLVSDPRRYRHTHTHTFAHTRTHTHIHIHTHCPWPTLFRVAVSAYACMLASYTLPYISLPLKMCLWIYFFMCVRLSDI